MSQKQYTTYQSEIGSFDLRDALLGVIKPGRYVGYDNMAEYDTQAGLNVYCRITHSEGINKYTSNVPPVLDAKRGVAISTQGTIIAEDENVDVTIGLQSGGANSGIWHVLYMEHEYQEIVGANTAIYAIKTGADNNTVPSLDDPNKQIPIGYIKEAIGATDFSGLTYSRAQSSSNFGDGSLAEKLWGSVVQRFLSLQETGTIPAGGALGNRQYTKENFIGNNESLTESVDKLDDQMGDQYDYIVDLLARKLDEWDTPTDNTALNATITYHGLLPKLSGNIEQFLNGLGSWSKPMGKRIKVNPALGNTYHGTYVYPTVGGSILDYNLSSIILDADADMLLLEIDIQSISALTSYIQRWLFWAKGHSANEASRFHLPANVGTNNGQIWVRMNPDRILRIQGVDADSTGNMEVRFKVIAWQTSNTS